MARRLGIILQNKYEQQKIIIMNFEEQKYANPVTLSSGTLEMNKEQEYPDARKHLITSFIKSGIRLVGYCLIPFNLGIAAVVLFISELVGIIEELVQL